MDEIKGSLILVLAAIGAYAVYQWWAHTHGHHTSLTGELSGYPSPVIQVTPSLSNMQPGVPEFVAIPIANGHGDQVSAAQASNPMATTPGSIIYTPAFGPSENQGPGANLGGI